MARVLAGGKRKAVISSSPKVVDDEYREIALAFLRQIQLISALHANKYAQTAKMVQTVTT